MPKPIDHARIQDLANRSSLIVTAVGPIDRREMQTLAADFVEFCCDWFRENGLEPKPESESDCSCQAGDFPP